jgi:very-short-patch-repair endonuclease
MDFPLSNRERRDMMPATNSPSPALRERVPSEARRVRAGRAADRGACKLRPHRTNKDDRLREFARDLRRLSPDAEIRLWAALRDRHLAGYRFRRQHPVGPFIVDFACTKHRLVIEADGGQHNGSVADGKRTAWLTQRGWRVLRFWNNDILTNTEGVLAAILAALRGG